MTPTPEVRKQESRHRAGIILDGAVLVGVVGAFAAGPLGTIIGMIAGGLMALVVEHFAETDSRTPHHTASPTK